MILHNDKKVFFEILRVTADEKGVPEEYIEKDYYVSYLLQNMVKISPDIIFKGGTSLSKCYQLIDRFSEDIDLNFRTLRPRDGNNDTEFRQFTTIQGRPARFLSACLWASTQAKK